MNESKTETCFTCKFYLPNTKHNKLCCKRFPPTVIGRSFLLLPIVKCYFPIPFPGEWCGEWRAKEE